MRKKIEEERKKILESGDLDRIVETTQRGGSGSVGGVGGIVGGAAGMGRGRGRGMRGVSNLPAWLVKQQKEAGAMKQGSETKQQSDDGQFDDSHQR